MSSSSDSDTVPSSPKKKQKKSVEEIYQKKTQLEHILLRPDTYIGSVETISQEMFILAGEKIVKKKIEYVPGFYKIFDEILVNAADNKLRDDKMDCIKVDIKNDGKNCLISVHNNGKGIPIEMHKVENVYVPELIFGHLLTSSNYNDNEKKTVGGRNGYGAKLCNIFSTKFVVETADKKHKYKQVFRDNMSIIEKPVITSSKEEFTRITFSPDLEKFSMDGLSEDVENLLKKRVYDLAGIVKNVKVYLNGERIGVKSFKQYVELYFSGDEERKKTDLVHEIVNDRWEIVLTHSEGQFEQISFVNSICTYKGGTHVSHVADQISTNLIEVVKKKNKAAPVKPFQVKNQLFLFINCLIENPSFDSQTKENMTLKEKSFGSVCKITEEFMNKAKKTAIVENVLSWAKVKQDMLLKKSDGSKRTRISGIAKLDDANNAGGRNAKNCTLILTEGDSAKTLAVSGLGVVGRDTYGVFPLRGKLLNVREAGHKQIMENAEITAIKQILGLQQGKKYTDVDGLRYGHLMIMTDQDFDGSHIKGLIINLFDYFWPGLLSIKGFLCEFITPIVKVSKGKQEISFFTIPEYEAWVAATDTNGWTIKYYKGLGTSTKEDAKKYFSNLGRHIKIFECEEQDRQLVDMAFSKKKADARKEWLRGYEPGVFLDHREEVVRVGDFIDKELILFSMADNIRSIPSVVDGLKPGLRKILYSCFKRNLTKGEAKVVQLAGYVSEHSAYHHGEQSLQTSIIGMAQNFVGSNNLNLLEPIGQFGSRLQGGKDAASPRYIFTRLTKLARIVFKADDDNILKYLKDDGDDIEPVWYIPILPMVLVNGGEGIGTGWSSSVPNYNPLDLVDCLKTLIEGRELTDENDLKPWYRGFKGRVSKIDRAKYNCDGLIEIINDTTVSITELPVRVWTQSYKEMIETWITEPGQKGNPNVKDYKEFHSDTTVSFEIHLNNPLTPEEIENEDVLLKRFKLHSTISLSNMVCFDQEGRIKKYNDVKEIILEFYQLRLKYYQKRKEFLVVELTKQYEMLENKERFLMMVVKGTLDIRQKKKQDLENELVEKNFKSFDGYNYLLNMPLWNLTLEKLEQLREQAQTKKNELDLLLEKSAKDLWLADLDEFVLEWNQFLTELGELEAANSVGANGNKKAKPVKAKAKPTAKAQVKMSAPEKENLPQKSDAAKSKVQSTIPSMFQVKTKVSPASYLSKKVTNIVLISDDEEDEPKKQATKPKKPVTKKVTKKKVKSESEDEASDDDFVVSDSEEEIKPKKTVTSRKINKKPVKKENSDDSMDDFIVSDNDDSDVVEEVKPKPVAKSKKVPVEDSGSDDSMFENTTVVKPKATAKKVVKKEVAPKAKLVKVTKPAVVTPPKPAKKKLVRKKDLSDDDDDEEEVDAMVIDDDEPPVKVTERRKRNVQKKVYTNDESEDGGSNDGESSFNEDEEEESEIDEDASE